MDFMKREALKPGQSEYKFVSLNNWDASAAMGGLEPVWNKKVIALAGRFRRFEDIAEMAVDILGRGKGILQTISNTKESIIARRIERDPELRIQRNLGQFCGSVYNRDNDTPSTEHRHFYEQEADIVIDAIRRMADGGSYRYRPAMLEHAEKLVEQLDQ